MWRMTAMADHLSRGMINWYKDHFSANVAKAIKT
jgi:hypothetical protein